MYSVAGSITFKTIALPSARFFTLSKAAADAVLQAIKIILQFFSSKKSVILNE